MNTAIQLLLNKIMQLGATLATTSQYQTFLRLHGHVSSVEIQIYAPSETFRKESHPRPIATAEAYYDISKWDWLTKEEQQARTKSTLEFMLAALHGYLPTKTGAAAELQEAA